MNEQIYTKTNENKIKVKDISLCLLSILIGRVSFINGSTPYSIAFFTASTGYTKKLNIIIGTSLILSTLLNGGIKTSLELIGIIALKKIIDKLQAIITNYKHNKKYINEIETDITPPKDNTKIECLKIFISIFSIKFMVMMLTRFLLYDLTLIILTSMLSALTYIFFDKSIKIIMDETKRKELNKKDYFSLWFLLSFAIAGIGNLTILNFNISNIISTFIVLLVARTSGVQYSIIAGLFVNLINTITNEININTIASYTLGGLFAGLLSETGNAGSIIGFILANTTITYFSNGYIKALIQIKEILFAGLLLYIIPQKYYKKSKISINLKNNIEQDELTPLLAEGVTEKLKGFSEAITDLSKEYTPISQTKKAVEKKDIDEFINRIIQKECKNCSKYNKCFNEQYIKTYDNITNLIEIIEKNGKINQEEVKEKLSKEIECQKIEQITNTLNNTYEIFKINLIWKKKMGENKELISDQLKNVSQAVNKIAEDIDLKIKYKDSEEMRLLYELENLGAKIDEITIQNDKGKKEATIYCQECMGMKKCKEHFEKVVSETLQKRMVKTGMVCLQNSKGRCMQKFESQELYKLDIGISKINSIKEEISGDSSTIIEIEEGKKAIILSDGMGTGKKAKIESQKVIDLLTKLLRNGIEKEVAINMINSSYILNSNEETYSTIDMAIIDVYTGKIEFIKNGACPSYIKRDKKVNIIKAITLPAGIFKNIQYEIASTELNEGEYLVMLSDGIIDTNRKNDWVYEYINQMPAYNAQQISDLILAKALKNCQGKPRDDMTVISIGINTKKE